MSLARPLSDYDSLQLSYEEDTGAISMIAIQILNSDVNDQMS